METKVYKRKIYFKGGFIRTLETFDSYCYTIEKSNDLILILFFEPL